MTFRSDVHVHWAKSPRIVHLLAPATSITVQDIVDTLRQLEAELGAIDDDSIIEATGKDDIGGGRFVGVTATLKNAKLFFGDRNIVLRTAAVTSTNTKQIIDTAADFIALGVQVGDMVANLNTLIGATVLGVVNSTTLEVHGIAGGFTLGDAYRVWQVVNCEVTGGNLVALDVNGDPMKAVIGGTFTHALVSFATEAALLEGASDAVWETAEQAWADGTMGARMKKLLTLAKYLGLK